MTEGDLAQDDVVAYNDKVLDIVCEYLSNNKEGLEITRKDLEKYPHAAINRLFSEIALDAANIEADPN